MKGIHWLEQGQWPSGMAITNDRRAYQRFMREYCGGKASDHPPFPPPNGGLCQHLVNPPRDIFIIAIGEHKDRDELASTLAHEATHLMRWLLEHIGENAPGTETQCYLVEHIVRSGLKVFPA